MLCAVLIRCARALGGRVEGCVASQPSNAMQATARRMTLVVRVVFMRLDGCGVCMPPNAKLTDDEERAKDNRIGTGG